MCEMDTFCSMALFPGKLTMKIHRWCIKTRTNIIVFLWFTMNLQIKVHFGAQDDVAFFIDFGRDGPQYDAVSLAVLTNTPQGLRCLAYSIVVPGID